MTATQPSNAIPARADVPAQFTWNAPSVFPSAAAWQAEFAALEAGLPSLEQYHGRLDEGPQTLLAAFHTLEDFMRRVSKVMLYAGMEQAVDAGNQEAARLYGQAHGLYSRALASQAYLEPELLGLGQEQIETWVKVYPELVVYSHYFDNLFRRAAHIRSVEVEELLGLLTDPFSNTGNTANLLTNADFKFQPAQDSQGQAFPLTQGTLGQLLALPDRGTRRSAWEHYQDQYLAHKNSLASNLATSIKQNVFKMHARRFPTSLEASLFANNVPVEVFYNLLDTFRQNLPTWHRYWELRRKALGVDQLEPYDVWAPLAPNRADIPYTQAVEWITAGLEPMGADYVQAVRQGCLQDRWVDIYPNQGKISGAFSYGVPGTFPFIVMSYNDNIFSLSTLAHELGHSMHSFLAWKTQPWVYTDYSLFVAEVASNFHQAMVRAYLLRQFPDRDFQISLIEEAMSNFHRYFLVMPTLARFELETHQQVEAGQGLTADGMIERMAELLREAYGPAMHVDTARMGITWATFGHLYEDYYVYQYATGISGANALANRILRGEPGAAGDYLRFLEAGSSVYPLEALKIAGVDLTSPQPVEETFQVMAGLVDRLEKLL